MSRTAGLTWSFGEIGLLGGVGRLEQVRAALPSIVCTDTIGARGSGGVEKDVCKLCCSLRKGGQLMILRIGASRLPFDSFAAPGGAVECGM